MRVARLSFAFVALCVCVHADLVTLPLRLHAGWNAFSVPAPVSEFSRETFFAGRLSGEIFSFSDGQYAKADTSEGLVPWHDFHATVRHLLGSITRRSATITTASSAA
jgi:hypothetical protein